MALFESTLILLLVAVLLLQLSRRFSVPYPTILCLSGVAVAALPWAPDIPAPDITLDPQLALALFVAPALVDVAYDTPFSALRRNWAPLLALAAVAVILTTAAVAWVGIALAGLPIAAAIAMGAIVAPPDAAAAAAMLGRFALPRRTVTVLQGESLLNDAVALLIFSAAVAVQSGMAGGAIPENLLPQLALAVPGGLLVGVLVGRIYGLLAPRLAGTLSGTIFEFLTTFGTWVIAERLHFSAILATVAFAMTVAQSAPERQPPRDRVHSYSVWEAVVFLLNVLAFLLMGLQARAIIGRLEGDRFWQAAGVAAAVFLAVVVVRVVWVLAYNRAAAFVVRRRGGHDGPTVGQGLVVGWCGMRGLVTLATAQALPASFPERDLIVLCAFAVLLGTLVVQGLTLGPLIVRLRFPPDDSFDRELSAARIALIDAAIAALEAHDDEAARAQLDSLQEARAATAAGQHPREVSESDRLKRDMIAVKRRRLAEMRRAGTIDDDVFHALEQELDWSELASSPPERLQLVEG